ncbi:MAG: phosphoribosyltransferase family protein [Clostridia bacterium]|nr:phosphoribosyltransferase family protein [Clostridia bacterium]
MRETYKITIAGCERDLDIFPISEDTSIAALIMFGDVELTVKTAEELLKKCPECDIIVSAESKGIPICYEMARQSGKPYAIARKSVKLYMDDPLCVEVKSITTAQVQKLYLATRDVEAIKGKKVLIVDDVISTGESLRALEKLIAQAGGEIVATAAVLAEGDAQNRDDIIFLEPLPLLKK